MEFYSCESHSIFNSSFVNLQFFIRQWSLLDMQFINHHLYSEIWISSPSSHRLILCVRLCGAWASDRNKKRAILFVFDMKKKNWIWSLVWIWYEELNLDLSRLLASTPLLSSSIRIGHCRLGPLLSLVSLLSPGSGPSPTLRSPLCVRGPCSRCRQIALVLALWLVFSSFLVF